MRKVYILSQTAMVLLALVVVATEFVTDTEQLGWGYWCAIVVFALTPSIGFGISYLFAGKQK